MFRPRKPQGRILTEIAKSNKRYRYYLGTLSRQFPFARSPNVVATYPGYDMEPVIPPELTDCVQPGDYAARDHQKRRNATTNGGGSHLRILIVVRPMACLRPEMRNL